jgi:hypothetical protein
MLPLFFARAAVRFLSEKRAAVKSHKKSHSNCFPLVGSRLIEVSVSLTESKSSQYYGATRSQ